ncbi:MAG: ECF-type riboflavin transporter substrate-binding protein [Oscillospiraceae bacterium]|nr:ECF-type riboflavin transporter substrate-binding protein [Oscillospiraceae bacterium]
MKRSSVNPLIIIGAGTALFFLLGFLLRVPGPVPGTSLPFEYALLAFVAAVFGPAAGLAAGLLGRFFVELALPGGMFWSWIIVSGVFGLLMGLACRRFRICRRPFGLTDAAAFILCAVISHLICWVLLLPVLEAVLYGGAYGAMLLQGLVICALGIAVTAVCGSLLCFVYSALRRHSARRRHNGAGLSEKDE